MPGGAFRLDVVLYRRNSIWSTFFAGGFRICPVSTTDFPQPSLSEGV
jgi:hypothetical protein